MPPRPPLAALLAPLALLLTGCTGGASPATAPAPDPSSPRAGTAPAALSWRGCEAGFQCATLAVPLGGGAGTAELAVTRRRAEGPGTRLGSLFVNPGGPGISAVDYLQAAYPGIPAELRQRFDLVAFDPRGVGRSTAAVHCETTAELDRYFALDPSPDDAAELTAYEQGNAAFDAACARRSGDLLAHVTTADAAADLDRLRAAVGEARLTYLGYSYGTALGAAYLEAYPTHVRAMVLDGALDPRLSWAGLLSGQAKGFDGALSALLANCEQKRCAFRDAVDGDLGAAFDALAARIDRTPLPAEGGRRLGPGEFSLGVGSGLYDRQNGWPTLAAALAAAQRGDGQPLLAMSDSYLQRTRSGYSNTVEANSAVNCADRPWPRATAPYTDLAAQVARTSPRFGAAIVLSGLVCARWPVPPAGTPHRVTGHGAPPVVVIGTTRDPATPYAWAKALAGQLDRAVLLTHEGDGHTVYRAGAPSCIVDPVDRYLLTTRTPAAATC